MRRYLILLLFTLFGSTVAAQDCNGIHFSLSVTIRDHGDYSVWELDSAIVVLTQNNKELGKWLSNDDGEVRIKNLCSDTSQIIMTCSKPGYKTDSVAFKPVADKIRFEKVHLKPLSQPAPVDSAFAGIPLFVKAEGYIGSGSGFHVSTGVFGVPTASGLLDWGPIELGISGSIGIDGLWKENVFYFGPRVSGGFSPLGTYTGGKVSLGYLTDFKTRQGWYFLPEYGLSFYGLFYVMAGYVVDLGNSMELNHLEGWRCSVGVNIPFAL